MHQVCNVFPYICVETFIVFCFVDGPEQKTLIEK